jgi:uncharacterized membrane protein YhaH (DUF805 family)
MRSLFVFEGKIQRLPYLVGALATFFSQHVVVFLAAQGRPPTLDGWFWLVPLRSLVTLERPSNLMLLLALAYLLAAAWALAALSFRRAADADIDEGVAALTIAPIVQIPIVLFLCLMPSQAARDRAPIGAQGGVEGSLWPAAAQGVVAGMALTLFAVAVGALVFGTYGFGMFVASPFVIGAATAYFANRRADIGGSRTASLVAGATTLGGAALILAALEGLICIILASPLAFLAAFIGGLFGRAVALSTRRSPAQTLPAFALLPLLFALESVLGTATRFETQQTIEVQAPPAAVWQAIVHMGSIDEPLALPFRLGVAYPLRGEIIGEGVGAVRHGEFSTGTALERVTEWEPNRKLAFVVSTDVPAMRELSPYRHVHAPHVVGYFRTTRTSFELLPLPDGGTEVVERTSHELRLEPVLYWLPMARWVVHANNARVLAHIRRHAERSVRSGE